MLNVMNVIMSCYQLSRLCHAFQTMELKGQMIHLPESDGILFLGSPSVEKLDELIAKGLYISDLPIHDATRDVILVGEQTKAQVWLTVKWPEAILLKQFQCKILSVLLFYIALVRKYQTMTSVASRRLALKKYFFFFFFFAVCQI